MTMTIFSSSVINFFRANHKAHSPHCALCQTNNCYCQRLCVATVVCTWLKSNAKSQQQLQVQKQQLGATAATQQQQKQKQQHRAGQWAPFGLHGSAC